MNDKARTAALAAAMVLLAAGPASAATLRGKVTQVDAQARTLTVQHGRTSMHFTLAKDVKVENDGKASDVAELATGEQVRVDYAVLDHGKQVVSRVDIQPDATRTRTPAPAGKPAPSRP